ncbi:hypothetical protein K413DRAFT_4772 [Clostridium sp. ASBs410]|nr:hypothetical protein K413DRAFT_4772 [Clostridium sp. ASBs410]
MKYEKIKIGDTTLDIAAGSCGLDPDRQGDIATVAIIIGDNTIDDIHTVLSSSETVTKYGTDSNKQWERYNLIYTRRMSINPSFPIGIEHVEDGTDDGKNIEVMGKVFIAEYKLPTMQDELQAKNAQIDRLNAENAYLSMMSGITV